MFSVFGEFTSSSGNKRSNRQLYLHPTHGSCYISDVRTAVGAERGGGSGTWGLQGRWRWRGLLQLGTLDKVHFRSKEQNWQRFEGRNSSSSQNITVIYLDPCVLTGSTLKEDWKISATGSGLFNTNLRNWKFILKVVGIHWVAEISKKSH